jgi:hypothetical protein
LINGDPSIYSLKLKFIKEGDIMKHNIKLMIALLAALTLTLSHLTCGGGGDGQAEGEGEASGEVQIEANVNFDPDVSFDSFAIENTSNAKIDAFITDTKNFYGAVKHLYASYRQTWIDAGEIVKVTFNPGDDFKAYVQEVIAKYKENLQGYQLSLKIEATVEANAALSVDNASASGEAGFQASASVEIVLTKDGEPVDWTLPDNPVKNYIEGLKAFYQKIGGLKELTKNIFEKGKELIDSGKAALEEAKNLKAMAIAKATKAINKAIAVNKKTFDALKAMLEFNVSVKAEFSAEASGSASS